MAQQNTASDMNLGKAILAVSASSAKKHQWLNTAHKAKRQEKIDRYLVNTGNRKIPELTDARSNRMVLKGINTIWKS